MWGPHQHACTHTRRKLQADTQSDKNRTESWPDFRVLCLLASSFKRAVTLYVPWQEHPLRITPDLETTSLKEADHAADPIGFHAADPIGFVGVYQHKPFFVEITERHADSEDEDAIEEDDSQGLESPMDMDSDEHSSPIPLWQRGRSSSQRSAKSGGAASSRGAGAQAAAAAGPSSLQDWDGEMTDEQTVSVGEEGTPPISPSLMHMSDSVHVPSMSVDMDEDELEHAGNQPYEFQVFSVSDWTRKEVRGKTYYFHNETDSVMTVENFNRVHADFAQFSERFLFVRCDQKKKVRRKTEGYDRLRVCEDAAAMSDNFICVFDGVGEGGYWSGTFARELARRSYSHSTIYMPSVKNRSTDILFDALEDAHRKALKDQSDEKRRARCKQLSARTGKVLMPRDGSSTALVLSLVRGRIYDSIYGDCRWALLHLEGGKYVCNHISAPMYVVRQSARSSGSAESEPMQCPMQFQSCTLANRKDLESSSSNKLMHGSLPVSEGDIVLAASDGFWDNAELEWGCGVELNKRISQCANEASKSKEPLAKAFGQKLADMAMKRMEMTGQDGGKKGKPDDISLVAARVTYSLLAEQRPPVHAGDAHGTNCDACNLAIESEQGHSVYMRGMPHSGAS